MELENMSDQELEAYKRIKRRINQLEKQIEFYNSEIPCRIIRDKIEGLELTLKANCEMLHFLFGEGCLRQ